MATHENLASLFTDIADAIRAKTEKTGAIVADNFPAEIAAIETVGDEEITITENGVHDVKKYATANVSVQSEPVLLWTNASPTSAFRSQTINVPVDYDGYLIEIKAAADTSYFRIGFVNVGDSNQSVSVAVGSSGTVFYTRFITAVNNGSIVFGSGLNENGVVYEYKYAIPTRIWGVKFTL